MNTPSSDKMSEEFVCLHFCLGCLCLTWESKLCWQELGCNDHRFFSFSKKTFLVERRFTTIGPGIWGDHVAKVRLFHKFTLLAPCHYSVVFFPKDFIVFFFLRSLTIQRFCWKTKETKPCIKQILSPAYPNWHPDPRSHWTVRGRGR